MSVKIEQVREKAKELGVKTGRVTKTELIRCIQLAEGFNPCFDTGKADWCGQYECCWRPACDGGREY